MDYMTMNFNRNGGGGTTDYSALSNKPSINDVTLAGNKTASDLGLMPAYEVDETPTESSDNLITSGAVYEADQSINGKLQGSKTVTGNPLTVTDAESMNAESVKVELEPKQDLHGYDKPWAGGAGKNKLPLVLSDIKTANTSGTWSGNTYTIGNRTFEILTDSSDNVTGIKVNGSDSSTHSFDVNISVNLGINAILNGCPAGGAEDTYEILTVGTSSTYRDRGAGVAFEWNTDVTARIVIRGGYSASNLVFQPMARISSVADPTFEPYSNICPISGYSEVNVENNTDTYTVSLGGTKYGGILDVTDGGYSDEWGYIEGDSVSDLVSAGMSSDTTSAGLYCMVLGSSAVSQADDQPATSDKLVCNNMENINANQSWGTNVSGICINQVGHVIFTVKDITTQADMDTWLSNNPIQIAYRKKTPTSVSTTPTDIPLLETTNNISTDGTNIELKYQPNNVIGECKAYTDEQVQKVLPTPPTTDGTYHLECSVSGGIPTISWVVNS